MTRLSDIRINLPMRKESLVSKAMAGARTTAMEQLVKAHQTYMEKIRELTYVPLDPDSRRSLGKLYGGFKEHRAVITSAVEHTESTLLVVAKIMKDALAEYDLNVREIEAWLTAAKAGEIIAGRDE